MFYEIFMWNFKHRISLKVCLTSNERHTNRDCIDRNIVVGNHVPPEFGINSYREQIFIECFSYMVSYNVLC